MQVKIKKLSQDAVIPSYAKYGDAGMDMVATSKWYDESGNVCYGTQLAFEIPEGYAGFLFPRSSNTKKNLILGNSVGVLDSGYRGEVVFKFKPTIIYTMDDDVDFVGVPYHNLNNYEIGDRIGQIIILPVPQVELIEVDELSSSDRGVGGFGSTDPVTASIESNYTP